jgi:hypothetical protein
VAVISYRFRFRPYPALEYISDEIEEFTGYSKDEFYANPSLGLRLVVEQDLDKAQGYFAGAEGMSEVEVIRWRHLDGRIITTTQRFTPIFEGGERVGFEAVATILGPTDPGGYPES